MSDAQCCAQLHAPCVVATMAELTDELAAFDAELKALEASSGASASASQSTISAPATKVISAAPVRSTISGQPAVSVSAPVAGAKVPPSQWATPAQIIDSLRSEGRVAPVLDHSQLASADE